MKTCLAVACVRSGTEGGTGDPHITESKDFVIAGSRDVSSVATCEPTLSNFFKMF